jgi:hypothetical protein
MEMAYRDRWEAEIAEMRRVLAPLAMKEERKWGKPTYTACPYPLLTRDRPGSNGLFSVPVI